MTLLGYQALTLKGKVGLPQIVEQLFLLNENWMRIDQQQKLVEKGLVTYGEIIQIFFLFETSD